MLGGLRAASVPPQGDRGFDGLAGLPGEKGHRVSAPRQRVPVTKARWAPCSSHGVPVSGLRSPPAGALPAGRLCAAHWAFAAFPVQHSGTLGTHAHTHAVRFPVTVPNMLRRGRDNVAQAPAPTFPSILRPSVRPSICGSWDRGRAGSGPARTELQPRTAPRAAGMRGPQRPPPWPPQPGAVALPGDGAGLRKRPEGCSSDALCVLGAPGGGLGQDDCPQDAGSPGDSVYSPCGPGPTSITTSRGTSCDPGKGRSGFGTFRVRIRERGNGGLGTSVRDPLRVANLTPVDFLG